MDERLTLTSLGCVASWVRSVNGLRRCGESATGSHPTPRYLGFDTRPAQFVDIQRPAFWSCTQAWKLGLIVKARTLAGATIHPTRRVSNCVLTHLTCSAQSRRTRRADEASDYRSANGSVGRCHGHRIREHGQRAAPSDAACCGQSRAALHDPRRPAPYRSRE